MKLELEDKTKTKFEMEEMFDHMLLFDLQKLHEECPTPVSASVTKAAGESTFNTVINFE